ncbi:MAG: hypothetical protein ACTSUE_01590 [Promethearchaeota archaeon]
MADDTEKYNPESIPIMERSRLEKITEYLVKHGTTEHYKGG